MYKIAFIEGDGIGPEIMDSVKMVLAELKVPLEWISLEIGQKAFEKFGNLLPDTTLDRITKVDATLKGPLETQIAAGHKSLNVSLRQALGLYANIRPVISYKGHGLFSAVDLVIFRENTEDLYAGVEYKRSEDEVHALKIITRKASTDIAKAGFDYARAHGRKRVTAVHKANIMKLSDGLFLDAVRAVAKDYAEITYDEVIVDNMCMQMVMSPEQFDVIITENLYGDILSDLAAGLVGGLGLVPSANLSMTTGIFEAVHGTAPNIAGKGLANPIALLLSSAMMLDYLGEKEAATKLRHAIESVLTACDPTVLTQDLKGNGTTRTLTTAICSALKGSGGAHD
jgi:isocitrate dehydrogenase (NAD+)